MIPTGFSVEAEAPTDDRSVVWPDVTATAEDLVLNSITSPVRVLTLLLKLSATDLVFHLKCETKSLNCVEKHLDSLFFWQSVDVLNNGLKMFK